jgi:outer membrane protein OmpA-like peptidoglycan-associated protein
MSDAGVARARDAAPRWIRKIAAFLTRRSSTMHSTRILVVLVVAAIATTGCESMSETQKGTAAGAGVGAAAGALIGAATAGGNRGRSAGTGAAVGAAAGALGGYVWSKRMEDQRQKMQQASAGTGIGVSQTADNRLRANIPADAGFDVNRSEIKPNLRTVLDRFAGTMTEHSVTTIEIIGHTDNTGSDTVNDPLSVARANATRDYLVSRGVSPQRISTSGRGERQPIASNDTEGGRAQNRRVEIFVAEAAAK